MLRCRRAGGSTHPRGVYGGASRLRCGASRLRFWPIRAYGGFVILRSRVSFLLLISFPGGCGGFVSLNLFCSRPVLVAVVSFGFGSRLFLVLIVVAGRKN